MKTDITGRLLCAGTPFLHLGYTRNSSDERNEKCYYIAQTKDTLSFLVTIKDRVNASVGDSEHDNFVQVPIKVIVLDENDVVPVFQNVSICECLFPLIVSILHLRSRWRKLGCRFTSFFFDTFSLIVCHFHFLPQRSYSSFFQNPIAGKFFFFWKYCKDRKLNCEISNDL